MKTLKIALAGNPNCGKSTVFNALTGGHQHVGNWPGKTVEKKEGWFTYQGHKCEVVDLPGTYSLTAYSQEEKIARDFILEEHPDLVVSIVDAANLERNLYLTLQLMELGVPVLLALNMMDIAAGKQIQVDDSQLSELLGVPVVRMTAREGKGIQELKDSLLKLANTADALPTALSYSAELDSAIAELETAIASKHGLAATKPARWLAIKLLENDAEVVSTLQADGHNTLIEQAAALRQNLVKNTEFSVETQLAESRYGFIHQLTQQVLQKPSGKVTSFSDRIDQIVTNRFLGIPIFLALMWVVFKLTTDVAGPFLDWVDGIIGGPISNWVVAIVGWVGLSGSWVESLLVDGIIAGVGGVLVFVPVMMSLYLALALLEDSGYMARAAFVMDRLMQGLGLHGKSFLPMIVGFGCTVPAIYATRTLENDRDRILTGLLVPFMSCGARLPVYVLFAAIFFPENTGLVIFSLYLLGIIVAIMLGLVLKKTLFKTDQTSPFVMELPPYRLPTFKSIWAHMWERTSHFVRKAWTIILATSVVIWLLLSIPVTGNGSFAEVEVGDSAFAGISSVIAPVFAPAGFDSWEASGSLLTGFVAKEVVVSTMSQVYELEEAEEEEDPTTFLQDLEYAGVSFLQASWDTLRSIPLIVGIDLFEGEEEAEPLDLMRAIEIGFEESSQGHGKLAATAFLIFILLYTPCMVAVAAARQEFGNRYMWYSVIGQFMLAWVFAVVVFQAGKLLGLG